jgi:surface-anchored protein
MITIHRTILATCLTALATLPASAALLYTQGHGDIGIAYDAVARVLDLHIHLHQFAVVGGIPLATDTEYQPNEITIAVPNPSVPRPASLSFSPIGIAPGQPMWFLPLTQDVNKPFLGVGAEELDQADWTGNVSLKLTGISGTGVTAGGFFSLWKTDDFGDKTFNWASADGLSASDILDVIPGSHAHYSMAFTKAGTYDITVEASATHVDGDEIVGSATYSFEVVPVPEPATTFIGMACIGIATLRRSRRQVRR